jgi:hypothetical protein
MIYDVRITGLSPLLMHWDNIAWSETLTKWQKDPANKKTSTKGDDRSPAWGWLGYMYADQGLAVIPSDNLMTAIREGGAKIPHRKGKGSETYKKYTQSCLLVNEVAWPVIVNGNTINTKEIFDALRDEMDFDIHAKYVAERGFNLFCKRAQIGAAKHVRVRPRFDQWEASGSITVMDDEQIPGDLLQQILEQAGAFCGLCDWRPSSPKSPGPFGRFSVTVKRNK